MIHDGIKNLGMFLLSRLSVTSDTTLDSAVNSMLVWTKHSGLCLVILKVLNLSAL